MGALIVLIESFRDWHPSASGGLSGIFSSSLFWPSLPYESVASTEFSDEDRARQWLSHTPCIQENVQGPGTVAASACASYMWLPCVYLGLGLLKKAEPMSVFSCSFSEVPETASWRWQVLREEGHAQAQAARPNGSGRTLASPRHWLFFCFLHLLLCIVVSSTINMTKKQE